MQTKDLVSTLKKFDAYPKTLEDFRVKTFGGAAGEYTINRIPNSHRNLVERFLC